MSKSAKPITPALLRQLNALDWAKILLQVEAGIITFLNVAPDSDSLPGGMQPRDLAYEAMLSVYSGERTWNQAKYPNIGKFLLYSVVKSKLNHLFNSKENQLKCLPSDVSLLLEDVQEREAVVRSLADKELVDTADSVETNFQVQDLVDKVLVRLEGDNLAQQVFKLRMLSYKDQEMATDLHVTIADVRAASKRIHRLGSKLLPKER